MRPDEYMRTLSRLGMSHPQAAAYLGVHRTTSNKWGAGERAIPMSVELALYLAGATGEDPEVVKAKAYAWGRDRRC